MDFDFHTLKDLFDQLGLPSDEHAIKGFVKQHAPLASSILITEASFWTSTQKEFLTEELLKDADWAEVIDLLNEQLRETSSY